MLYIMYETDFLTHRKMAC